MDDLIQQGINALKSGDRENARKLLLAAIKQNPDSERAWQWMFNVCVSDRDRIQCLNQIVRINPQNTKANQLLRELNSSAQISTSGRTKKKSNASLFLVVGFVVILCFFSIGSLALKILTTSNDLNTLTPVFANTEIPLSIASTTFPTTATLTIFPTLSVTPILSPTRRPTWTLEPTFTPFVLSTLLPPSTSVCSCTSDKYNCDDFSSQGAAQACYSSCVSAGKGDIHGLDQNNNGLACEGN